ncbi:hypothetical protein [Clostridium aciditolerans]|uniref:Uncharacterized protein n=1 Tax=Clostridium aciditolerans TaxID=339861 RepID=A0A934HQQ8_9CLOT|nr:hypothetical protein [Clostridium aciditolerans]MBI6872585.1 hypothetical protein [Clostridium aciditolerans]
MSDKNIEMMKKIIEAKKNKSSQQGALRPEKNIGGSRKAIKSGKTGGLFDK